MAVPATAQRAMANQMRGMSVPPIGTPADHPMQLPAQRKRGSRRTRGAGRMRKRG